MNTACCNTMIASLFHLGGQKPVLLTCKNELDVDENESVVEVIDPSPDVP